MSINPVFIHDFQKHIEAVQDEYARVCEENTSLRQRMQEWRKEDEIQKLEEQNRSVQRRSLAVLTDIEFDELNKFRDQHYESCKRRAFGYFLSGTGIGTVIEVQCVHCGEKKNITDYDAW
jgi:uncharacterized protein CbrC (UPF0167 family)